MATVKKVKKAQTGTKLDVGKYLEESRKRVKAVTDSARKQEIKKGINTYDDYLKSKVKKAKTGKQMLKRADGSVSQRGLWDNIRAAAKKNKAAGKPGKKPTAQMLKQERKIKAKSKK